MELAVAQIAASPSILCSRLHGAKTSSQLTRPAKGRGGTRQGQWTRHLLEHGLGDQPMCFGGGMVAIPEKPLIRITGGQLHRIHHAAIRDVRQAIGSRLTADLIEQSKGIKCHQIHLGVGRFQAGGLCTAGLTSSANWFSLPIVALFTA